MKKSILLIASLSMLLFVSCNKSDEDEKPEINENAPVVTDDVVQMKQGEKVFVDILANDKDPNDSYIEIESLGKISDDFVIEKYNRKITITASIDVAVGSYSFEYKVKNKTGDIGSGEVFVTVSEKPKEKFFTFQGEKYSAKIGNWISAQSFGYDYAWADATNEDITIYFYVSAALDYDTKGKTFKLTTVSSKEDLKKNEVFIKLYDTRKGWQKGVTYNVNEGQTIEMKVTGVSPIDIDSIFSFENLELEDGSKTSGYVMGN